LKTLGIVLLCVGAAIVYGIIHDQITSRICVEYFTIGHVDLFQTADPTLLGIGWGIAATWWAGLFLGMGVAYAARHGTREPRPIASLIRPVITLMAITGACAAIAGMVGYASASAHLITLTGAMAEEVPPARHIAFLTDLWIHNASYDVGFIGGIVLCINVWRSRKNRKREIEPHQVTGTIL
jgi:hypothetical protein